MGRPRKDLTGRIRGKLKVISLDEETGKWACQCECGNIIYLSSHEWFYNQNSSCGCANKRKDITDKKYGRLTAKYPTGELDKFRRALWYCQCECGGHKVAAINDLEAGLVKSCGCLYEENQKKIGEVAKEWLKDGTDLRKINAMQPYKGNTTGYRGVTKDKKTGRYSARIFCKGKQTHLGVYDTPEEASAAYLKAKEDLQTEYQNELSKKSSAPTHHPIIKKEKERLVYYTPENRYVNITELCKLSGVSRVTLYSRLNKGYTGEELWCTKLPNKRKANTYVIYNGKSVSISELASLTGINKETLRYRYNQGYRGEELCKKQGHCRWIDYKGDEITLADLSKRTGIGYSTLHNRYKKGDRGNELWREAEISVDYYGRMVTLKELSNITKIPYNTLVVRHLAGDRGDYLWRPLYAKRKIK